MDLTHVIAERENKKIYRDGAKAIKVFAEGYSKADILNEALNTARVEETGLPIPKLLAVYPAAGRFHPAGCVRNMACASLSFLPK